MIAIIIWCWVETYFTSELFMESNSPTTKHCSWLLLRLLTQRSIWQTKVRTTTAMPAAIRLLSCTYHKQMSGEDSLGMRRCFKHSPLSIIRPKVLLPWLSEKGSRHSAGGRGEAEKERSRLHQWASFVTWGRIINYADANKMKLINVPIITF